MLRSLMGFIYDDISLDNKRESITYIEYDELSYMICM